MTVTYYCSITDVEAVMPTVVPTGGFSATTRPSDDQVDGYIAQIDGEMRGVMEAAGYATNPTDTTALALLSLYASYGVAAMVLLAARSKETDQAAAFRTLYEAGLAKIRRGEVYGMAAVSAFSAALPRSRYTSYPADYPEPRFQLGKTQW